MSTNTASIDRTEETATTGVANSSVRLQGAMSALKSAKCIQKLMLKPSGHNKIPLGSFDEKHPPKGFLVELEPETSSPNGIVTVITRMPLANKYAMYLHISNHSAKPVNADVWQL